MAFSINGTIKFGATIFSIGLSSSLYLAFLGGGLGDLWCTSFISLKNWKKTLLNYFSLIMNNHQRKEQIKFDNINLSKDDILFLFQQTQIRC